ncbi:alpha/beta hydrolase [Paracoccus aurantiacus]|uniref:Alpha/beta hydrolase n=1 Tax=Paracoccus aurantiacus TaxID=2599412 RepID=A0A5C6S0N4_9RHOB|nr:alpha/beta hydrolase [Paracoccus aurantiacus]TXB68208.1 alpha/beta hydrolase [Paracoccus aurantiacus]
MTETAENWTESASRRLVRTGFGTIPVVIAGADSPAGTVLLVHGRNGAPGQAQIAEIADAYLSRGWRVVAPELPNSIALPDSGPADQVRFSTHTKAAGAVWDWLCDEFSDERLALAGHSIGAYAIAHLAAGSTRADHVLAVSPPMSGMVLLRAREAMGPAAIKAVIAEAPLFHAEMTSADASDALGRITAPLGVVTGASDGLVPLKDARAYFNAAPDGRFFAAIPDEHHCPAGPRCAAMLAAALSALGA